MTIIILTCHTRVSHSVSCRLSVSQIHYGQPRTVTSSDSILINFVTLIIMVKYYISDTIISLLKKIVHSLKLLFKLT